MRICYFGTYRVEYSRNKIMIEGLTRNEVEVIECHETLWRGVEDRVQTTSGGWRKPAFWWRVLRVYIRLVWRYFHTVDHDILVVGYPGQFDVYLAKILALLRGKPLVWDIFMSIYLIALERGLDQDSPFTINLIRRIENWALRLPDLLIADTEEYTRWLSQTHGVSVNCFRLVPTGADDRIFKPEERVPAAEGKFIVVYYGTFIPNHGVQQIIKAARLLVHEDEIQFELIGNGPERISAENLAQEYALNNLRFMDWMEPKDLIQHVAQADICLGAFGTTPQSMMTVQNKIYECLAMAKPVISGESIAVRQAFRAGQEIYLCQRENERSLADTILDLYRDPKLRQDLACKGYLAFIENYSLDKIGFCYKEHLLQLLSGP